MFGWNRNFDEMTKELAYAEQDGKCNRCGKVVGPESKGHWEAHHKIAHSKGGTTSLRNCEILCSDCHKKTSSYGRK